jgi:hypothetical protein
MEGFDCSCAGKIRKYPEGWDFLGFPVPPNGILGSRGIPMGSRTHTSRDRESPESHRRLGIPPEKSLCWDFWEGYHGIWHPMGHGTFATPGRDLGSRPFPRDPIPCRPTGSQNPIRRDRKSEEIPSFGTLRDSTRARAIEAFDWKGGSTGVDTRHMMLHQCGIPTFRVPRSRTNPQGKSPCFHGKPFSLFQSLIHNNF